MTANLQRRLTASEQAWLDVRRYLREHRTALTEIAVAEYPSIDKVADSTLLTQQAWTLDRPIPLDEISLEFEPDTIYSGVTGTGEESAGALPTRSDGSRHPSYADAIGTLTPPSVFENRATYRLLEADLSSRYPRMRFGRGQYFDGINTGEAAAHELAAAHMGMLDTCRLRNTIGNPCDLLRRPANLALSTLTIRHDRTRDRATCLLHWRDPAKVGHAGGLYQVVPVGIFQPSGEAAWNEQNDFSLWRNTVRELAEELLGTTEDYNSENAPIDYDSWPFAARLSEAHMAGALRIYCLGLGVDPLTYATDLLTAAVIDAPVFDELIGAAASAHNAEGRVLQAVPFEGEALRSLISQQPFQAAGEAVLKLALNGQIV